MRYLGGKTKIAKHIIPLMLLHRTPEQYFVDMFTGGTNIACAVGGNVIANDSHYELIKMWQAVQQGWDIPTNISEKLYQSIKATPNNYPPELVAFAGFGCSFGGKYFGGYARSGGRNYANEARKGILRKAKNLTKTIFINQNYVDVEIPPNSIIYCDPPYANTTEYSSGKFDNAQFWDWALHMSKLHTLFVSEFIAPQPFKCIWEQKRKISTAIKSYQTKTERLFTYKGDN